MLRITQTMVIRWSYIMTDVATEEVPSTVLRIPVVKGKSYLEIDTATLPEHVYREMLIQGGKVLLNRGQTKLTKEAYPDPEKLKEAAMAAAEQTLQNMYEGKIRIVGGAKSDKVPREVMTEARRIAKSLIKEEMKRSGIKVSYVESSTITQAANALLADKPELIEQAREEVERRTAATSKMRIDISGIQVSQKKIKAAEARKADKTLSAAKTGKVATRARPDLRQ
jgi:hypothetical protein